MGNLKNLLIIFSIISYSAFGTCENFSSFLEDISNLNQNENHCLQNNNEDEGKKEIKINPNSWK